MKASPADIAVLIPCYNEAVTIGKVVADFKKALPGARIYVFDNRSTDRTAEIARSQGATVVYSPRAGKGNVVRHMFSEIDAEIYVMVDGDDTYPAELAPKLIDSFEQAHADMLVGTRISNFQEKSFRRFHVFGNKLVAKLISTLFDVHVTDVLSGYRVFSKNFTKTVPLVSPGFEIETEMTLQAAAKRFAIHEVPISYGERPEGSFSKLNTFSDGFLVLKALFFIFKDYKPLVFFSFFGILFALISLGVGSVPIMDYYKFRYVHHVPLAILAAAIAIIAVLTLMVGLILDTVRKYHEEEFELWRKNLTQ